MFYFTGFLFFVKIFWTSFVRTGFFGIAFVASIISLHVIIQLPIIIPKYLPFSQVHVLEFQM